MSRFQGYLGLYVEWSKTTARVQIINYCLLLNCLLSDQTLILRNGNYTLQTYVGDVINDASEITVTLISQSIVGVDIQAKLKPVTEISIPSPRGLISALASKPKTSKPQIETKMLSPLNEPTKTSGLLDRFSFQPYRPKKLAKDKSDTNSRPIAIPNSPVEKPNFHPSAAGGISGTQAVDPSDSHLECDKPNFDVIEISSSSSRYSDKSTNSIKGMGINGQSKNHRGAEKKMQKNIPQNVKDNAQHVENDIVPTVPDDECLLEAAKSKEDLGFDVDELFHSSSNENLSDSRDVKEEVIVTQRSTENVNPSKPEIAGPLDTPSTSNLTCHRLEPPLTHYSSNFDGIVEAPEDFTEMDDHTPDTQEDEFNDLFFGMSSEDVECEIVPCCSTSDRDYDQFTNSDPNEGFKFSEIPGKLRTEYNNIPTNTGRFGWRPPNTEHQISQSAQDYITTRSVVSETFTEQIYGPQPLTPYDFRPVCTPRKSASTSTIEGPSICSFPVQDCSSLVVAPDQGSEVASIDPRSLEYACRVQLSSAFLEPYAQDYSSGYYGQYANESQWPQPQPFPRKSSAGYPAGTQSHIPMLYHPQVRSSQGYTAQPVSSKTDVYLDRYQPSFNSRIPQSDLSHHSTPAACGSTPQTSRPPGVARQPQSSAVQLSSQLSSEPSMDKLVLQYSSGHSHLPRAPALKRRRTSSGDSGVESSVCTSLSSLMAIHGGYSKSLNRNEL